MTNEQLAAFIKQGGNDELIPILWERVRKLMYMKTGFAFVYKVAGRKIQTDVKLKYGFFRERQPIFKYGGSPAPMFIKL